MRRHCFPRLRRFIRSLLWPTNSRRYLIIRCGLNIAKDAQEVAAEELFHVLGGIASRHQCSSDFRQIGSGVNAFGGNGNTIEVGTDANVVDAGDFDDVIEVGNKRIEWCPSDSRGELAIDLVGSAVWNGKAFGFIPCCKSIL